MRCDHVVLVVLSFVLVFLTFVTTPFMCLDVANTMTLHMANNHLLREGKMTLEGN